MQLYQLEVEVLYFTNPRSCHEISFKVNMHFPLGRKKIHLATSWIYHVWSKLMLFTSVAAFHWLHDDELTSQGIKAASFDRKSLRSLKLGNFFALELHEQTFSNWTELMISLMVELLWTKKVSSLFKYDFDSSQKAPFWSSPFSRRALLFSHFQHPTGIYLPNEQK